MSWLIDWMPWWFIPGLIGLGLLVTMQLWLPIATVIWNGLPNWARWVLGGGAAALLAYLAGRNKGRRNAAEEQRRKDAAAIKTRLETNQEVQKMTPAQRKKEIDSWLRD